MNVELHLKDSSDALDQIVARWVILLALDPAPTCRRNAQALGELIQAETLVVSVKADGLTGCV